MNLMQLTRQKNGSYCFILSKDISKYKNRMLKIWWSFHNYKLRKNFNSYVSQVKDDIICYQHTMYSRSCFVSYWPCKSTDAINTKFISIAMTSCAGFTIWCSPNLEDVQCEQTRHLHVWFKGEIKVSYCNITNMFAFLLAKLWQVKQFRLWPSKARKSKLYLFINLKIKWENITGN